MSNLTEFKKLAEEHNERLSKIIKSWKKAEKEAKEKIHRDSKAERNKLIEEIVKLRAEETQQTENLSKSEEQAIKELTQIREQLNSASKTTAPKSSTEQPIELQIQELRKQQMSQLWSETMQDINAIVEKHKDRANRIEESLAKRLSEAKLQVTSGSNTSTERDLRDRERTILDSRLKNSRECVTNLNRISKEINKLVQQINDLNKREKEKLTKVEESTILKEERDRHTEDTRFLEKIKSIKK